MSDCFPQWPQGICPFCCAHWVVVGICVPATVRSSGQRSYATAGRLRWRKEAEGWRPRVTSLLSPIRAAESAPKARNEHAGAHMWIPLVNQYNFPKPMSCSFDPEVSEQNHNVPAVFSACPDSQMNKQITGAADNKVLDDFPCRNSA